MFCVGRYGLSWEIKQWMSVRSRPSVSGPIYPMPIKTCPGARARSITRFSIQVMDENGNNIHSEYSRGVTLALAEIQEEDIDFVILQSRNPTCGINQIYDGCQKSKSVTYQSN